MSIFLSEIPYRKRKSQLLISFDSFLAHEKNEICVKHEVKVIHFIRSESRTKNVEKKIYVCKLEHAKFR